MAPIKPQDKEIDPTLHLPRILCLHGGGVNADIFRLQARTLINQLKPYFRLVFADGPFICDPHPAVIPIYKDYGPFRRWLRWLPEHAPIDPDAAIDEVDYYIQSAIDEDDRNGGTGSWVGLMGFSQGAKMAASILFRQQVREEKLGRAKAGSDYRFAVLLAGRAPLVSLDSAIVKSESLVGAGGIAMEFTDWPDEWTFSVQNQDHMLKLPTVHVHGLNDPGLELHRRLLDQYCEPGTTRCVVWGGDHRVPFKQPDVDPIVKNILEVARETGSLKR